MLNYFSISYISRCAEKRTPVFCKIGLPVLVLFIYSISSLDVSLIVGASRSTIGMSAGASSPRAAHILER